jgi:hypothetical protein
MLNKKPFVLFLLACLLFCTGAFAQVSVNPLIGSASVVIPVYSAQRGSMSFSINLVYTGGQGVKPTDIESTAGIGWQIQAGGQISRLVRGLPDDSEADSTGATKTGWMYNTNQSAINFFTLANTGVLNCTNEATDYNYIMDHFPITRDTEPDLFFVSAPGLSCQLVWNQATGKFQPVSYQDLAISYTTNATTHAITGFTITNDRGIKYVFSIMEEASRKITGTSVNYMPNIYAQYQHRINYNDAWYQRALSQT